jgi:hypothetical protein
MATAVRGKEPIAGRKISTFSPVAADTAHSRKSTTTNKKTPSNAQCYVSLQLTKVSTIFGNFFKFSRPTHHQTDSFVSKTKDVAD